MYRYSLLIGLVVFHQISVVQAQRLRDVGIKIGVLSTGKLNAITDVTGVKDRKSVV